LRNLVFVALMGTAVILIVGLPETLWPRLDGRVLRMFKASLGPLAASVTLYYLGQWMGGLREDAVMNRITNWSAAVMGVLALGLALAALAWWGHSMPWRSITALSRRTWRPPANTGARLLPR